MIRARTPKEEKTGCYWVSVAYLYKSFVEVLTGGRYTSNVPRALLAYDLEKKGHKYCSAVLYRLIKKELQK